jgi:hypothetical protein
MTSISETAVSRLVRPEAASCLLLVGQKEEGNLSEGQVKATARLSLPK